MIAQTYLFDLIDVTALPALLNTATVSMSTGRYIPGTHSMASNFPRGMVIVAGNSHKQLADDVAR